MAESLSRRKYSKLVKFLTGVMEDEKMSHRSRMVAAQRLDDILARNEARADRARERAQRQATRVGVPEPATASESTETTPELTAEQEAEAFLETMRKKAYASQ
jgi:hypothetical protein